MSDGETESNLGGIVEGAGFGWLEGSVNNRAGLGYFVGGRVGTRMPIISREKSFLVIWVLARRGSA